MRRIETVFELEDINEILKSIKKNEIKPILMQHKETGDSVASIPEYLKWNGILQKLERWKNHLEFLRKEKYERRDS